MYLYIFPCTCICILYHESSNVKPSVNLMRISLKKTKQNMNTTESERRLVINLFTYYTYLHIRKIIINV